MFRLILPGCDSGSAYVFVRTGITWSQQAKLTAGDAALNDEFGIAVGISGDTAMVGAWRDDEACTSDPDCDSGSVYVGTVVDLALQIDPVNALVASGNTQDFDAAGGLRPHTYSLQDNLSGATIDPGTGLYTAGATSEVTDTAQVTDANGYTADAIETVNPP